MTMKRANNNHSFQNASWTMVMALPTSPIAPEMPTSIVFLCLLEPCPVTPVGMHASLAYVDHTIP